MKFSPGVQMEDEKNDLPQYATNFDKILRDAPKDKKIAIFCHPGPDPDAMGAMMGLEHLINGVYGLECVGFFDGTVSHPQNLAMVNLLEPNMRPVAEYKPEEYSLNCLVDAIPNNAGTGNKPIDFQIVIDHHKDVPNGNFNGLFIHLKNAAASSTVFHLMKLFGVKFSDDNDNDSRVATALMVGIATDTETLLADDTTEYELIAWSELFQYRDIMAIKRIINFEMPMFWVEKISQAAKDVVISEGLGIVGLGMLDSKHEALISTVASHMITWENITTAIAFAIVDGEKVRGSIRSKSASTSVATLSKELAVKYHGGGGGKLGKGAYEYLLGGASLDDEDDDITRTETWELVKKREVRRIQKTVKPKG